jgi:hypothetical protein
MQEAGVNRIAERVARNDAMFRDANEEIARSAVDADVERAPFICECADPGCTQIVRLTVGEYEALRRNPTHFVNVPGHQDSAQGYVRVVSSGDGFVVVEKLGEVAEIVEELDPRRSDSGE